MAGQRTGSAKMFHERLRMWFQTGEFFKHKGSKVTQKHHKVITERGCHHFMKVADFSSKEWFSLSSLDTQEPH